MLGSIDVSLVGILASAGDITQLTAEGDAWPARCLLLALLFLLVLLTFQMLFVGLWF